MIAPQFGRVRIEDNQYIKAHSFFYTLANRNYVRPALHNLLQETASNFQKKQPGIQIIYLDANFPFINKFPLLPHLSHNDGKKIDITLIYKDGNTTITNQKRSISGYGVFEEPAITKNSKKDLCIKKGYWQYDFPKYLTFGTINTTITFSKEATKQLIQEFLKQSKTQKIFIEPHLKNRMKLNHPKIRFHGCQAVRHDDHIHLQIQ